MGQRKAWAAQKRPQTRATGPRRVPVARTGNALFLGLCRASGIPSPIPEFRFAPPRRWRFDYAWPDAKLALEVDGGLFTGGRHVQGAAILATHEKLNTAAMRGWRILYTTPRQLAAMLPVIRQALDA